MIYQQNNMMIIQPYDFGRFSEIHQLISIGPLAVADDSSHVISPRYVFK